jgi:response regulator RpfG family c-di-GMP phosphodiesterase
MADRFIRAHDPEETLSHIGLESGRAFNPETVRTFSRWFHLSGAEIELVPPPVDALREVGSGAQVLLERFADRVDAHNGVNERWRRVARIAMGSAVALGLGNEERRDLALACRIFGAGEITDKTIEDEAFDPLARLGVEQRARNATAAAELAAPYATLREAARIVGARGEWFDGTGKPHGRARTEIPSASGILAGAIAYDRLDRGERIDTAAGTQFDPAVVRAIMEAAKLRA